MSHFVEHDKSAEFAVCQSEKGATAEIDAIHGDLAAVFDFTLSKKAVGEGEGNAVVTRGVCHKGAGAKKAELELWWKQQALLVEIEDVEDVAGGFLALNWIECVECEMAIEPVDRATTAQIESGGWAESEHEIGLGGMDRFGDQANVGDELDADLLMGSTGRLEKRS